MVLFSRKLTVDPCLGSCRAPRKHKAADGIAQQAVNLNVTQSRARTDRGTLKEAQ